MEQGLIATPTNFLKLGLSGDLALHLSIILKGDETLDAAMWIREYLETKLKEKKKLKLRETF